MVNRSIGKLRKGTGSTDGTFEAVNWKRKRTSYSSDSESEQNVQMVKRGPGRPRKNDTSIQGSSQVNSKKSRSYNYSESEDGVQESRPRRKSARHVNYNESDYDFEDSPIKKKNKRRTIVSENNDASSSLSSLDKSFSELELDFGDLAVEEKSDIELAEVPVRKTIPKQKETRNHTDENVEKWFDHKRARNPGMVKSRPERWTKEQKSRLKEAFAASRKPNEKTIADLVAELELTTVQVKQYFAKQRHENPIPGEIPRVLSKEEAEPTLMEYFQRDPNFHDYGNTELREQTGWSRRRLAEYLMERSFVLKMLENHRDREVHVEQEEVVLDYQINENRSAESDVQQAKDERGNENGGNGIDTSDEAPIDQELYGQIDLPVPENPVPEFKNIPLFNNPREKDQKPTGVNHIQNAFNDFQDETKNVPLFVPAPGYRDQSQEPREEVEEKFII
ncbi:Protein CBG17529 [Caenorhabditis briggsae]|uniref:Protein CBG17529 n=1 Tax=Caenorhabditis briggsae TaxID=6238 RepID=A8XR63_CAEBR|nr:Protein CBG17529 [Caenorhabditis briggsae]CAP35160.2 Protein CBG17529 [Caenorhabditis briggsae]